jgi:hypothetical protein
MLLWMLDKNTIKKNTNNIILILIKKIRMILFSFLRKDEINETQNKEKN